MQIRFKMTPLPPVAIPIKRQGVGITPPARKELMRAVVDFAVHSGLNRISKNVVARLNRDCYFPYVFFPLLDHDNFYYSHESTNYYEERRIALRAVLTGDRKGIDRLLCRGISLCLNNFPTSMPGGSNRKMAAAFPDVYQDMQPVFGTIDHLLATRGIANLARKWGEAAFDDYNKRLPYLKICLDIYQEMVDKYGFDAGLLWR